MDLPALCDSSGKIHTVQFKDHTVAVKFRYFSPKRSHTHTHSNQLSTSKLIQNIEYQQQEQVGHFQQKQSQIQREYQTVRVEDYENDKTHKVEHNPKIVSNKYYDKQPGEIRYQIEDYFEDFHNKMLTKLVVGDKDNKIIKLRLIRPSKSPTVKTRPTIKLLKNKKNKIQQPPQHEQPKQKSSTIKNQQNKSKEVIKKYNPSQIRWNDKNKIKIKLYVENYDKNNGFNTPRDRDKSCRRKGISVYSSTSTRKHSLDQNSIQSLQNKKKPLTQRSSLIRNGKRDTLNTLKLGTNRTQNTGISRPSIIQRQQPKIDHPLVISILPIKKRVFSKSIGIDNRIRVHAALKSARKTKLFKS